ncbi:MAG: EAL domain-containing protein [Lachnospiraceae bacterium]|nr:EAL domain-containing protein [Lachnospiraceae bacterium]
MLGDLDDMVQESDRESYRVIAGLVTDILFEYDFSTGRIMNRVCRDGEFGVPRYIENPRVNLRAKIYPGDYGLFDQFMEDVCSGKERIYAELRMLRVSGEFYWTAFEGKTVYGADKKPVRVVGRIKILEGQETKDGRDYNRERRDPLTKVLNRASCEEILKTYFRAKPGEKTALMLVDIDGFYRVNQKMGHVFGDEVLVEIANAVRRSLSQTDELGRVGGDTFLVCMKGIRDREEVEERLLEVIQSVAGIYIGEQADYKLSASIGVAMYPQDGMSYTKLFECAIEAITWGKLNAVGTYTFWDAAMKEEYRRLRKIPAAAREYDTFDNIRMESYDPFAYELMELAFRLIEDRLDADSVINLMLHRVADEYDLSGIGIRETVNRPYTMRHSYEYLRKDYTVSRLGETVTQKKERWDRFRGAYKDGYAVFCGASLPEGMPKEWFNEMGSVYTLLEIPMFRKQEFIGCIDFCDAYENREWDSNEIHTLKMFGRILTDFLFGMRALEQTTERVELLQERDSLTGLYQYNVFLKKLQILIDSANPGELCIVSSDIRHFKYINENYGISVGDQLLRSFAEELGVSNGMMLLATRIYSDNVVAVTHVPAGMSAEKLGKIIVAFNEAFSAKARKQYLNGKLNINSGYYIIQGNEKAETVVSNANMARKRAKEPGYAGMAIMFEDSMIEKVRKEGQLIDALPDAIKNRELQVYLQPKVSCVTGEIIGAEALVRWQKPDGKFYYPDEFIPVFERNGNIVELDYYVYREVFAWLRRRLDADGFAVPVSMNVSRFHLRDDKLISYIKELMEEYRVPAKYLEFELTENLYIENTDHVIPMIIELRGMGIKVSMDDFGSGYSSLNVLNDLPIDVIKLDKVFMKKSELREGDKTIISCVVEMAKKLHITVLCEGVENADQDQFLRGIGCDIIQGYYYGKPMPIGDFEQLLLTGNEG